MIERIQRAGLWAAWLCAAILLLRFAADFFLEMPLILAIPFAILVVAALLVALMNLLAAGKTRSTAIDDETETVTGLSKPLQALLLLAIPLGFLASTLDCSGLAPRGCTPFCTFIKLAWIPLIAMACGVYFFKAASWLLVVINLMSFVTLLPHCLCFNVGNGWWIERLGASPMCYVWGFVVGLISVSALINQARVWPSIVVSGAIIGGASAFFISHHYFHFPW
jgi:hypothetical protein